MSFRPVTSPPPVELATLVPEPTNLWTEASPRWRGRDDVPWLDLRTLDLGGAGPVGGARLRDSRSAPGSIYLPARDARRRAEVAELISWSLELGGVLVTHAPVGESDVAVEGCVPVLDLLAILLEHDWERLGEAASGAAPSSSDFTESIFVWPLVPALTDDAELIGEGLDRLARLGARTVLPRVPALTPRTRRLLSERLGEDAFDRVFHAGRGVDPRAFASECTARGLDYLPRRPLGRRSDRRLERRIAAELSLIAEIWPEAGGSEPSAQVFYRAARWFETTERDVESLWRDGNLGVVPWIDPEIETVVSELAGGAERSTLLERLARQWARPTD